MLSLGSLAVALCTLALLPSGLGLSACGTWVRFRSSALAPSLSLGLFPAPKLETSTEPPAQLLPFPLPQLWDGLAWLDTMWVFSVGWQAACLLSGALLLLYLNSLVRRPQRKKMLRAAAVPLETGHQGKCSCNSYEVLCRVEANAILMSKYLRRLRHLCLEDAKRQLPKKKAENAGDKEKILSDCLHKSSSSADLEVQGN